MSDALRGVVLDGRYRIDRLLAVGGMSTVWTATDLRLDREVAVKIMAPEFARDPAFVERFVREARSAARLSHVNVVAVLDQGSDGAHAFLVMELVRGRTLRDLLLERGRLTPEEAVAVAEPVLAGLSAAHRSGLVHRDVKPENVLLGDDGVVKVADFGLARAVASASAAGGPLIGTVDYLSPEQISAGTATARSDVYAAGIVLYEMLTGHPPYAGGTAMSIAYRHVHSDVPPPSFSGAPLPDQLDSLVVAATRREPHERPADAGGFLAELWDVRSDLGLARVTVPTRPRDTPSEPARHGPTSTLRPARGRTAVLGGEGHPDPERRPATARVPAAARRQRRPVLLALLLVVLLGLVAGAGGWWYAEGRWTNVPDLTSLSEAEIEATARDAGLDVTFAPAVFDEAVPSGQAVSLDPEMGREVLRGTEITVVLSMGPERFTVDPALVGQPRAAVEDALSALPVEPDFRDAFDDTLRAGLVVGFDPPAGTALRRDQVVVVTVSRGPAPVPVPDVVGLDRQAAIDAVRGADLNSNVVEAFSNDVAAGLVISQDPTTDVDPVPPGTTVTVTVSKGPDLVLVPDVGDLSLSEATAVLEAAGFEVVGTCFLCSDGDVINQDPDAGERVLRGSRVSVLASI